MTEEELALCRKVNDWMKSPIGLAFIRYEIASNKYRWKAGRYKAASKKLNKLCRAEAKARTAFLVALRGW